MAGWIFAIFFAAIGISCVLEGLNNWALERMAVRDQAVGRLDMIAQFIIGPPGIYYDFPGGRLGSPIFSVAVLIAYGLVVLLIIGGTAKTISGLL